MSVPVASNTELGVKATEIDLSEFWVTDKLDTFKIKTRGTCPLVTSVKVIFPEVLVGIEPDTVTVADE